MIASAGEGNQDYLRELGAAPVLYGDGVADRVRDAAGGQVDGVIDVVGKTPIAELIGLVSDARQRSSRSPTSGPASPGAG